MDVLFQSTRIQCILCYNKIQFILSIPIISWLIFWHPTLSFHFWPCLFQHSGEFTVSLSDVLLTWKYLLHEKLNLPIENMEMIDHYEDIRRTYDDFLKNSNMLDLIDVYKKCVVASNCETNANISPVSIFLKQFYHSQIKIWLDLFLF